MGIKHKLFYGTLDLHQAVARKMGGSVQFIPDYLKNCEAQFGTIVKIPIPDQGGTVVLLKYG